MAQSEEVARAARSDLELQQREQERRARKAKRDEERKACRGFVETQLRDWLLLTIRGGGWHLTHKLSEGIEARLPADLAVRRYRLSGRSPDRVITSQKAQGKYLFLKDVVQLLRRQGLIEVRIRADGEEEIKSTPRKDPRFEIDAEFRAALPRSPDEIARLEAQLLAEGCRDPLVVWKGHGLLVDGHTRYELLSLLGRRYEVIEMDFKERSAVIDWLWDTHQGRRNLSPECKAYRIGREYLAAKTSHGGARKPASSGRPNLKRTRTSQVLGKKYGLNGETVCAYGRFAAALDQVAANCGDDVRQKMLSRAIKWTRGDIERLAKLEPGEQKRVVKKALASGKRPKSPPIGATSKLLNFPLDDSEAQADLLDRLLKGEQLGKLYEAVGERLQRRSATSNVNGTRVNRFHEGGNGVAANGNSSAVREMGRLNGCAVHEAG